MEVLITHYKQNIPPLCLSPQQLIQFTYSKCIARPNFQTIRGPNPYKPILNKLSLLFNILTRFPLQSAIKTSMWKGL